MGEKPKNKAVLPWMRSPVDVSLFEHCPLHLLPSLDPRYILLSLSLSLYISFLCFLSRTQYLFCVILSIYQLLLLLYVCIYVRLKMGLENMDISSLYPVQVGVWQETIGPGAFQRDLCIQSPTGSGKTLAYALPIVQTLSNRAIKCLRALVVLPNRDLAIQVLDFIAFLCFYHFF